MQGHLVFDRVKEEGGGFCRERDTGSNPSKLSSEVPLKRRGNGVGQRSDRNEGHHWKGGDSPFDLIFNQGGPCFG